MKKVISYLVFTAYFIGMIKPALPGMADALAHTFYELEHTNTVHKHNGQSHVHQEVIAFKKEAATNKTTPAPKSDISVQPHFASKVACYLLPLVSAQRIYATLHLFYSSASIFIKYPPPKF